MSNGKTVKFTDWGPGQPDNVFRQNDHQYEDCMHIFSLRYGLKWNDAFCSDELYFICEQDVIHYEYCAS